MRRIAGLFHKRRQDADLEEELASHLEMLAEQNVERGMTPKEARRVARVELGGAEQIKEAVRDQRGVPLLESLWQDIRFGRRMLRKNRGFTATAILTLAIGIGANTAIFSMVNWLILRPLPIYQPNKVVQVYSTSKNGGINRRFSFPDFLEIEKDSSDAFSGVAALNLTNLDGLSLGGKSQPMLTCYVSGNFFQFLGVQPFLGRLFLPSEGRVEGADPILVISYSYWTSRFNSDRSIIGHRAVINGQPVTIVGVTPLDFHGLSNLLDYQGYLPEAMEYAFKDASRNFQDPGYVSLAVISRLKRGVNLQKAQVALKVIGPRLPDHKRGNNASLRAVALNPASFVISPTNPGILNVISSLLIALAACLLVIVCVNIANLFLVRAGARQREVAMRAALGATRGRLIRQLLTESLLLAAFGCGGGIALGVAAMKLIGSVSLHTIVPMVLDFPFDWRVFGYALATAALTGMLVGIMPALRAGRGDFNEVLHGGGRTLTSGSPRLRTALIAAQVGTALMLLIVAGLFVRSLENVQHADLGFDPNHLLNATIDTHEAGYDENQTRDFQKLLVERADALPGVESASLAFSVPMSYTSDGRNLTDIDGYTPLPGGSGTFAGINRVSPGYFATMRIPLIEGRDFRDSDNQNSKHVAIVNQAFVARYWHGQDAIGRHFAITGDREHPIEVVGVAKNSRDDDLFTENEPFFYTPLSQDYDPINTLQLRTSLPPKAFATDVVELIHSLDPAMPVFDVQPMTVTLEGVNGLLLFRVGAALAATLGLIGLILAIVGVYGVISYSASQRTNEIGIRMALGAHPAQILKMVLGQGLAIVGVGLVVGIALAAAVSKLVSNLLFGVGGVDPLTYAAASILLAGAAIFACYVPARRAMRVDPMVALRHE
jgi:predicted permease